MRVFPTADIDIKSKGTIRKSSMLVSHPVVSGPNYVSYYLYHTDWPQRATHVRALVYRSGEPKEWLYDVDRFTGGDGRQGLYYRFYSTYTRFYLYRINGSVNDVLLTTYSFEENYND